MIPVSTFCYVVQEMVEVALGEVANNGITETISTVTSFEGSIYNQSGAHLKQCQQNQVEEHPEEDKSISNDEVPRSSSTEGIADLITIATNNEECSTSEKQLPSLKAAIEQVDTKEVLSEVWSDIASVGGRSVSAASHFMGNVSMNVTNISETAVKTVTRNMSRLNQEDDKKASSSSVKAKDEEVEATKNTVTEPGVKSGAGTGGISIDVDDRNSHVENCRRTSFGNEGRDMAPQPLPSLRASNWKTARTEEKFYGDYSVVSAADGGSIVVDGDIQMLPRSKQRNTRIRSRQVDNVECEVSLNSQRTGSSSTEPSFGVFVASPKGCRRQNMQVNGTTVYHIEGRSRHPKSKDLVNDARDLCVIATPARRGIRKKNWFPRRRKEI